MTFEGTWHQMPGTPGLVVIREGEARTVARW